MALRCSILVACALGLVLVACGDSSSGSTTGAAIGAPAGPPAPGVWQPNLPENTHDVIWGDTVTERGCRFTIGTAVESPPFPPVYLALVERAGEPRHCKVGHVVLGTSYARPSVAIASGHGAVVADFSFKSTPSGSAHTALAVVQVSPESGVVLRRTTLAAAPPDAMHPQLGNVEGGALAIGSAGDLTVTGSKDGIIPGEVGSGDRYTAVYDHFTHAETNPAPSSVAAF